MQLLERIDRHAEAALHVCRGGFAERRQAQLKRVAAHRGILHGTRQRLDRDVRGRKVRIPRPDVDDIDTLLDQPPLDRGQLGHGIRR